MCMLYFFSVIIGASIGSFIYVLVLRNLPGHRKSLLLPSHCGDCRHPLRYWELIPVLSYFILKGRCRYCQKPISMRYAIVELLAAVLAVLSVYFSHNYFQALDVFIFCMLMLAIALIDWDAWLIPLPWVFISIFFSLLFAYFEDYALLQARLIGMGAAFAFLSLFLLLSTWI